MGDSETNIGKALIMPKLITNIDSLLMDVQGSYGIEVNNLSELFESDKFIKLSLEKVKIKRIYSWLGYLFWELYQDIVFHRNIKFCKYCSNIIAGGRKDRIYCNKEENKDCFNKRNADRQRKWFNK